jgi:outer membrane protein assembly factor BamB
MRLQSLRLTVLLAGVLAAVGLTDASEWSRFRGPNGTGVGQGHGIPVKWSEKEGILWKTALPGLGNSSPVIWGDRLFLQSAREDGTERLLVCLRVADGKILWTQTVAGRPSRKHPKNSFASSTPATDGERVYCLFWDGTDLALHAFDFEGRRVWKHDLGRLTSQHGAGASPMVYQGKVYLANDQDGKAELVALDAQNGQMIWKAERRAFRACYATPLIWEEPGRGVELVVASTAGLTGYDPQTGQAIWDWSWSFYGKPLRTVASPLAAAGMLFANGGDGDGSRHAVAVKVDGKDSDIKADLVWEDTRQLPYVPTMLLAGSFLYYVNDSGMAGCREIKTGKPVWSQRLGGNVSASPVLIDGKIYAANEDGMVFVFSAADRFQLLAKNSLGEPVFASPAVAENRLFIRGQQHLFCIGKSNGKSR